MTGPGAVGASWSAGLRGTRFVLGMATLGLATYARWWWRLLRADNLHDHGMIRRRRAWLVVWTLSTLLLFGACLPIVGSRVARAVGLVPLLGVLVAAVVSTVAMWRQGRRARKAPAVAAVAHTAPSPVLDMGEWSDTNPRTQAAERAIGDLLWKLGDSGWSPADALTVVAQLPPFSQATVLWCAESNLARFSEQGGQLEMGPALWFFDFATRLRGWLGGGPTTAVAEPAMRRAS